MSTTIFAVHVELERRDLTPEEADRLVDELAEWHAAVGTSPRGWADVQMSIPGATLEGAVKLAIGVAARAFDASPLTVSAMTEAEFDARLGAPAALPDLVSVTEAAEHIGVSRQRVLQMVDEGKLSSTRIGNAIAIPRSEVDARVERSAADSVSMMWDVVDEPARAED